MTAALRELSTTGRGAELAPGYRVVDRIARGRQFDVYDVWSEERLCRCVAKTLREDRLGDASARRRLEHEGRLLRRLTHPHLVRAYEVVPGPRPVTVLETMSGATLARLIASGIGFSPQEVAMLGLQLCSAVAYLHRHGYVHLDLRPSIVVAEGGRAKVVDLSAARRPGRVPPGTGTSRYLSPEQAAGGAVGPPADVWGIGVVLYEAATGLPALGADADSESALSRQPEVPPPSLAGRRGVPSELGHAIDACLALEPDARASAEELWALLERVPDVPSLRAPRKRV